MGELITVEINLEIDTLLKLFFLAHERNITFNKLIGIILKEYIDGIHESDKSDRAGDDTKVDRT